MSTDIATAEPEEISSRNEFQRMKKVIISCVAGSALEWYDFAVYSYFATIIGKLFFPSGDTYLQLVASLGTFASGLLARPIGAAVFGYIGDILGRKKALVISIYMMAIPTTLMGVLPTYEQMGMTAGVLLILIRFIQGLALGGGFGGTIVFLYEHASRKRKATYSSWAPFSLVSGFIMGACVATCVNSVCDAQQLESFGWRIPFILSVFGTAIANYVKHRLEDPKEFLEHQKQANTAPQMNMTQSLMNLFSNHWKGVFLVVCIDALTASGYFLIATFLVSYFEEFLHISHNTSCLIQNICMPFLAIMILVGGWCADRFGKRTQMITASIFLIAFVWPFFNIMQSGDFLSVIMAEIGIIVLFAIYYGPIPATICSIFPTSVRLLGVSIAHNIAMAVFGGGALMLAPKLIHTTGCVTSPAILFIISSAITAIALYIWKEER